MLAEWVNTELRRSITNDNRMLLMALSRVCLEIAKKIQIIYLNQFDNYRKVKTEYVFFNMIFERSAK